MGFWLYVVAIWPMEVVGGGCRGITEPAKGGPALGGGKEGKMPGGPDNVGGMGALGYICPNAVDGNSPAAVPDWVAGPLNPWPVYEKPEL